MKLCIKETGENLRKKELDNELANREDKRNAQNFNAFIQVKYLQSSNALST